ncbi:hypothetical protein CEXT_322471 [Caerostris extrusa]|uniref:Uncharacterized protein n=1 Tax=Caerostris extrusa TaxID=172846 RepID=A0AAV4N2Y9_CAEEX|nr:hypothetical protein CEXT_322471 [Caerostris extrusa]
MTAPSTLVNFCPGPLSLENWCHFVHVLSIRAQMESFYGKQRQSSQPYTIRAVECKLSKLVNKWKFFLGLRCAVGETNVFLAMTLQEFWADKLLAHSRILYHNSTSSIEANDSLHQLLPGSTFIRELVPFCPCSVYPAQMVSFYGKQRQSSQPDTIRAGSSTKSGHKHNLLNYKRGGYCHGPRHDIYWNGVRCKEKTFSCLVHGSSR